VSRKPAQRRNGKHGDGRRCTRDQTQHRWGRSSPSQVSVYQRPRQCVARQIIKDESNQDDPVWYALSDKIPKGSARCFFTQPPRSFLPIDVVNIDVVHDCIYHCSSRLALWQNLREHDMINFAFRRPNNAPSERPTPVAPAPSITLKLRAAMRSFSFSPGEGSTTGRTRDVFTPHPTGDQLSASLTTSTRTPGCNGRSVGIQRPPDWTPRRDSAQRPHLLLLDSSPQYMRLGQAVLR
jgi:hypothetical protein